MSTTTQMESALQSLAEFADCIEEDGRPHLMRHLLPISTHELEDARRKIMEDIERRMQELKEFFAKYYAAQHVVDAQIERFTEHVLHRSQSRTSGTGKTPAKKHASSGTGGGGGGDSDGDGPHRTRTKKQRRSSSNRNNSLQRPPNVPPGAIATTSSPQSPHPSPQHSSGLIICIVVILLIFVAYLLDKEERDMAWSILGPLSAAVILYIKPPSKRN